MPEPNKAQSPTQTSPPNPTKTAEEPSGYYGGNPSTAGPGQTAVRSDTPENALGHLNPSAPGDSNVTPGSTDDK